MLLPTFLFLFRKQREITNFYHFSSQNYHFRKNRYILRRRLQLNLAKQLHCSIEYASIMYLYTYIHYYSVQYTQQIHVYMHAHVCIVQTGVHKLSLRQINYFVSRPHQGLLTQVSTGLDGGQKSLLWSGVHAQHMTVCKR